MFHADKVAQTPGVVPSLKYKKMPSNLRKTSLNNCCIFNVDLEITAEITSRYVQIILPGLESRQIHYGTMKLRFQYILVFLRHTNNIVVAEQHAHVVFLIVQENFGVPVFFREQYQQTIIGIIPLQDNTLNTIPRRIHRFQVCGGHFNFLHRSLARIQFRKHNPGNNAEHDKSEEKGEGFSQH